MRRRETTLAAVLLEKFNALSREWSSNPLTLVLGKESEGVGTYSSCIERCILNSTACRNMRTYKFHNYNLLYCENNKIYAGKGYFIKI